MRPTKASMRHLVHMEIAKECSRSPCPLHSTVQTLVCSDARCLAILQLLQLPAQLRVLHEKNPWSMRKGWGLGGEGAAGKPTGRASLGGSSRRSHIMTFESTRFASSGHGWQPPDGSSQAGPSLLTRRQTGGPFKASPDLRRCMAAA